MARFMRKGINRWYFVPTISNKTAPTAVEINAGTDLTDAIAEVSGFTFTNTAINVPDMGTAFVKKIPGEDSTEDSSITFYEDKTTNPIRTALAKNTVGYVVIFSTGIADVIPPLAVAAADKCEVWGVVVASNARRYSVDNVAAQYVVAFTTTDPPVEGTVA